MLAILSGEIRSKFIKLIFKYMSSYNCNRNANNNKYFFYKRYGKDRVRVSQRRRKLNVYPEQNPCNYAPRSNRNKKTAYSHMGMLSAIRENVKKGAEKVAKIFLYELRLVTGMVKITFCRVRNVSGL